MPDQMPTTYKNLPLIHLIYSNSGLPTLDDGLITDRIAAIKASSNGEGIAIAWDIQDTQKFLGRLRFGGHRLQVAGLASPLPRAIVDRTIHVSHWQPQIKAAMRQHRSHLSLVYTGDHPDPVEKMIALYSAAHAIKSEDLLGLVNEGAWTAHPPADFLSPEKISQYRQEIPFILWVGYVRFYVDKQRFWLATKGHHIFDVPDLAYFTQPNDDLDEIINHFINIFYYVYEQDVVVAPGDTLEVSGGHFMKFSEVPENADYLMGPSGTLVIEKIAPDEVNP